MEEQIQPRRICILLVQGCW